MTPTMTVAELGRLLGISRKTVYEAAARGEIPHLRVGRRVIFPRAAVERWFALQGEILPVTRAG